MGKVVGCFQFLLKGKNETEFEINDVLCTSLFDKVLRKKYAYSKDFPSSGGCQDLLLKFQQIFVSIFWYFFLHKNKWIERIDNIRRVRLKKCAKIREKIYGFVIFFYQVDANDAISFLWVSEFTRDGWRNSVENVSFWGWKVSSVTKSENFETRWIIGYYFIYMR